jgi:ribosome-associated toxin RatA of RatAB toxin-antitoxin module
MIEYKSDVIVNRPVQDVFALIKNVSRFDEWTDMNGTRLVSGEKLHVGSQIETTIKFGPVNQTMTFEVIGYEENRRVAFKTISKGLVAWDAEYLFMPEGDSTKVISSGQLKLNGLLKISEPLLAGEIQSGEAKELVKYKEIIEMA